MLKRTIASITMGGEGSKCHAGMKTRPASWSGSTDISQGTPVRVLSYSRDALQSDLPSAKAVNKPVSGNETQDPSVISERTTAEWATHRGNLSLQLITYSDVEVTHKLLSKKVGQESPKRGLGRLIILEILARPSSGY